MTTHLIIPDPHAHPDYNNDRFTWLGRLVCDIRPDHVVCIGDWPDMPSLCSYDKGTKGFEGRRYKHDIEASIDALEKFHSPIRDRKKKLPKFWMLEGNHDHRIIRAIDSAAAQLDGIISLSDLQFADYGWEYITYRRSSPDILTVDGINYAHYFPSGVMGRPIGGERPALMLLTKHHLSCTQGHIHVSDYCIRTNAYGRHIQGMLVGCYIDYDADFAGLANDLWWRGVVVKRNVENGMYDPQWISMDAIRKEYA